MADIEIVIKIPEESYKHILEHRLDHEIWENKLHLAVINGTPLPKGHGRLIDADYKISSDGRTVNSVCGYMATTIIEADRSEEE